jgi:Fe-Mn family superoxide dismutase
MAFKLPSLPYGYDALEPYIDAQTMEIHHTKHHQAYINNVNKALEGHADLDKLGVEELLQRVQAVPQDIRQTVINNAGGHANHSLFWQVMGKGKGGEPKGDLAGAIKSTFGDFAAFKDKLSSAALTRFGSGWGWLVLDSGGSGLQVISTANQDSPLMVGQTPLLGIDVWEHAYYLKYQNKRPDYIAAWWNTVNWDKVADLYASARGRWQ